MRAIAAIAFAGGLYCASALAADVSGTWTKIGTGRGAVRVQSVGTIVVLQSETPPTTQEPDAYVDGQTHSFVRLCGSADVWVKLAGEDISLVTATFEPDVRPTCSCNGRWTLLACNAQRQHRG